MFFFKKNRGLGAAHPAASTSLPELVRCEGAAHLPLPLLLTPSGPPTMGVKTQLAMIAALGCAALLLLRWSPSDVIKVNYSGAANIRGLLGEGGKGTHKAAGGCAAAPSPKPPVSIEWTGRESMTVSYKEGVDVEVYKHEFPGSTLCACWWPR